VGIRTGAALLQSLQDGRQLFIDGERVGDVTTDPRFAAAAHSLAELYAHPQIRGARPGSLTSDDR
jgi:4-hydroxyphenylacetate 3-monooxygenase